jgi:hypothetical protein
MLADRYGASNRATARLTGLELEALGYVVATDQKAR